MKLLHLVGLVALLGLLAFAGYIHQSSRIDILSFAPSSVNEVDDSGFTINGDLNVINSGLFDASLPSVQYTIVLDATNDTLGTGTLESIVLPAGSETPIEMSQNVEWKSTIATAIQLAFSTDVNATITGEVTITLPVVGDYTVPFEKKFDIKDYLVDYVAAQAKTGNVEDVLDSDFARNIGNTIGNIFGQ